MTRLAITCHDAGAPLVADLIYVDPAGNPDPAPLRSELLRPGVPLAITLKPGNVLVVREPTEPEAAARGLESA